MKKGFWVRGVGKEGGLYMYGYGWVWLRNNGIMGIRWGGRDKMGRKKNSV